MIQPFIDALNAFERQWLEYFFLRVRLPGFMGSRVNAFFSSILKMATIPGCGLYNSGSYPLKSGFLLVLHCRTFWSGCTRQ
jgi:hypothetical protein